MNEIDFSILEYLKQSNDKLEPFNNKIDFIPICQFIYKSIKSKDYNNIPKSIIDLRRLLKYEKQIFETLFDTISHLIFYIIKSEDENITEEILIFLCEIILQRRLFGNFFYDWLSEFIYNLIKISINDSNEKIKLLAEFILNHLTEDIGMLKIFMIYFNVTDDNNLHMKAYNLFFQTLLKNVQSIKENIHIPWNEIYRFLGNIYKQGEKDLVLKSVNEIKKICKNNGINYQIILEQFTEYGIINSNLYEEIRNKNIK